jgi:Domain of unknown function (DUF4136)
MLHPALPLNPGPLAPAAGQPPATPGIPATPASPAARRGSRGLAAGLAALSLGLAGCASLNTVHTEVSTFGSWPAGRSPGSFAIERLPSQQALGDDQAALEAGAAAALQRAGFQPASAGTAADVTVQIGARISRESRGPWDDPLWWHAWGPRWHQIAWYQPGWAWRSQLDRPEYRREVAVLIRDRASGQAVYEARARTDGVSRGGQEILDAMFAAALQNFPQVRPEPHDVPVALR